MNHMLCIYCYVFPPMTYLDAKLKSEFLLKGLFKIIPEQELKWKALFFISVCANLFVYVQPGVH